MAILQWRALAAGELDHEKLWLAVGAGAVALAAIGARAGVRLPRCAFHVVTGYPCPGCGSTRAMVQLTHGHVAQALTFNPLFTLVVLTAAAWALYAAAVLVGRRPRLRIGKVPPRGALAIRLGIVSAVLLNWWWVIAHGL